MLRESYTSVPSGRGSTLWTQETVDYTSKWIDNHFELKPRCGRHQMRWLMNQLASLALTKTIKTDGDGDAYEERLVQAYNLLDGVWYVVTPAKLQGWGLRGEPAEGIEAQQAAKRVLWQRRDPLLGYREGFESSYHTWFAKDDFARYVADYLANPWMRHPVLDWIFVDAFVTWELSQWGEEVKRRYLPGRRDMLGVFHHRYYETNGNLAQMTEQDWAGRCRYLFWYVSLAIVAPVAGIWAAFAYDWTTTGMWLTGIYAPLAVIELGWAAYQLIRRAILTARGAPKPGSRAQNLWSAMYEVWRLLEGPVVNPTRVRAEMAKTTDKGADWNSAAWAIVDRVIAHDPAVWLVTPAAGP